MTMHTFSYVFTTTASETMKTFTFPSPVMAGSMCVDAASISCCPQGNFLRGRSDPLSLSTSGMLRVVDPGVTQYGQHFTSNRKSDRLVESAIPYRSGIKAITLDNRFGPISDQCEGATIEYKMCITLSDYRHGTIATTECVCDENCVPDGNNPTAISYVGVTGVT